MAETRTFQYPGDPALVVQFLTGAAFVAQAGERHITMRDLQGRVIHDAIIHEVICDSCNALIGPEDRCAHVPATARLYCTACAAEWIEPYLLPAGPEDLDHRMSAR